jgi:hypothetical protein
MWPFKKKKKKKQIDTTNQMLFDRRMDNIKTIADRLMQPAQCGQTFPVRTSVVVDWADLLNIWDIADRAKSDTGVK